MKLIELQTEKSRIESMLREGSYLELVDASKIKDVKKEAEVKRKYSEDQMLLKKLDNVNNVLNEAYAITYIDVQGIRISLATAKEYCKEVAVKRLSPFGLDLEDENHFSYSKWHNLHIYIMNKCVAVAENRNFCPEEKQMLFDPLNLIDRKTEFEEQQRIWSLKLTEAVAIAEATTDIVCNY